MRITRKGGGDEPPHLDFDDPNLIEITQKHEALKGRAASLEDRNASLMNQLAQHEALLEDQQYNFEPTPVLPWSSKPELFLHVVRWLIVARMLLFGMVEKFGSDLPYVGLGGDILFALLTIWVLYAWTKAEWHANSYLLIQRMILAVTSIVIAANTFTHGAIWDGSFLPEPTAAAQPADQPEGQIKDQPAASAPETLDSSSDLVPTIWASAFSLFFLMLAASRYCAWELFRSQRFLDHPLRIFRRAKEHFRDKR